MALKMVVDTVEGLSADVLKEYKKGEDGKFHLETEGGEDIGALKRAKDYEKEERKKAAALAKDASAKAEKLEEELNEMRRGAIPKADSEKLEKSWAEKLDKVKTELTGERDSALKTIQTLLVDNVAQNIAQKIAIQGSSDVLIPHIKQRLVTEKTSDGYITRVLDKEGKPSAASIEELQKELTTDKRFAPIIVGSKASGGGANGGGGNGGGAPTTDFSKFNPNKANPKEMAAFLRAKRAEKGLPDPTE